MLKIFSDEKIFLTHFAIVLPKQKVVRSNRSDSMFIYLQDSVAQLDRAFHDAFASCLIGRSCVRTNCDSINRLRSSLG